MPDKILGERIRQRREHLGLTQEMLAKKLGYSDKTAISKIESGQRELNQSKIKAFAKHLLTTPSYLMGWTDDPRDYEEILDSYGKKIPIRFMPHEDQQTRAREYIRHIETEAFLLSDYVNAIDEDAPTFKDILFKAYRDSSPNIKKAVCTLLDIEDK